ncbi:MAG: hypothetical protein GX555_18490 [Actinomycetales bacterium]|nr:hypothetical protein [Actinomycetales bacterium]
MIVKVSAQGGRLALGSHMPGLIRYLVGPGRANEHTDPHLVASSEVMAQAFAGSEWDARKTGDLVRVLDGDWRKARRAAGLPVVAMQDESTVPGPVRAAHVLHVSLSLHRDEGRLSDEQWAAIASDYVEAMGFTASSGKARSQWAAFRHGLSRQGNDHIHLVVSMVREDGTRASEWQMFARSRRAADEIEARYGLRRVKDDAAERGLPGYTGAEAAKATRQGREEPDRFQVARRLRAAAAVSDGEAEFVRSARMAGLLVRPRFAPGGTGEVIGFAAAIRPQDGQSPVWFAGGTLDRNLALPRLRERWEQTEEATQEALGEWRKANTAWQVRARSQAAVTARGLAGPEWTELPGVNIPLEAARDIARVNRQLAEVELGDRGAWTRAAQEAAGVFATWSVATEGDRPGPLARASDALARSAQPWRGSAEAPVLKPGMAGRHLRLLTRAGSDRPGTGWTAVMRQVDATVTAIHQAHEARGELVRAGYIAAQAQEGLDGIRAELAAGTPDPAMSAGSAKGSTPAAPRWVRQPARHHDPHRPGPESAPGSRDGSRDHGR